MNKNELLELVARPKQGTTDYVELRGEQIKVRGLTAHQSSVYMNKALRLEPEFGKDSNIATVVPEIPDDANEEDVADLLATAESEAEQKRQEESREVLTRLMASDFDKNPFVYLLQHGVYEPKLDEDSAGIFFAALNFDELMPFIEKIQGCTNVSGEEDIDDMGK